VTGLKPPPTSDLRGRRLAELLGIVPGWRGLRSLFVKFGVLPRVEASPKTQLSLPRQLPSGDGRPELRCAQEAVAPAPLDPNLKTIRPHAKN
jgi:hypothetical protein